MTPRLVLSTVNARYSHTSFGLRYLLANLGALRPHAVLREFILGQAPLYMAEQLLHEAPDLVAFGVYIWNVTEITAVVRLLRALRPDLRIVIGGPEVSHEFEDTPLFALCDHLIVGEGEVAFAGLCRELLAGGTPPKVIRAAPPEVPALALPYDEYTDTDLRERLIYVEASRGCPFQCEFCLSALDERVRPFPLPPLLAALSRLCERGARGFKFVDRTFNLSRAHATAILDWGLEVCQRHPGFQLHFEMIPDRLPPEILARLAAFPPGAVQLELGVQTFTPAVLASISRRQDAERTAHNLRALRTQTAAHLHADLIFGLPGETLESFAASFDALLGMGPDEIQLGLLKRLRGAPIARHTDSAGLVFSPLPPYEILQTAAVPFAIMAQVRRLARYLDLYFNSGDFTDTIQTLFQEGQTPFWAFHDFAGWLYDRYGQTHEIALSRRYERLFLYLTGRGHTAEPLAERLLIDYDRHKVRRERLEFLKPYVASLAPPPAPHAHAQGETARTARRTGQPRTGPSRTTPRLRVVE